MMIVLPAGLRWGNSGGSVVGGANGHHIARVGTSGTLCGRYAPHEPSPPSRPGTRICRTCARLAGVPAEVGLNDG